MLNTIAIIEQAFVTRLGRAGIRNFVFRHFFCHMHIAVNS